MLKNRRHGDYSEFGDLYLKNNQGELHFRPEKTNKNPMWNKETF